MPVARNVWQQVEGGSPVSSARRFIIRRKSVRPTGRSVMWRRRSIERNSGVFFSRSMAAAFRYASMYTSALWWAETSWRLPPSPPGTEWSGQSQPRLIRGPAFPGGFGEKVLGYRIKNLRCGELAGVTQNHDSPMIPLSRPPTGHTVRRFCLHHPASFLHGEDDGQYRKPTPEQAS